MAHILQAVEGSAVDTVKVTRALLSVSDKAGLVELATSLASHGVELLSTGGTAKAMRAAGLTVTDVSEYTGFPEMMDGRVKTLHPSVHGGIMHVRGNEEHEEAMKSQGMKAIDLVVLNLYPFEATVAKGSGFDTCIENIDIGGPSMLRSSAKNHKYVTICTSPEQYPAVMAEMQANDGCTTLGTRRSFAAAAYALSAAYDSAISSWFCGELGSAAPVTSRVYHREMGLKYGCNPQQKAAGVYSLSGRDLPFTVLSGVPGYINLLDAMNAWQLVKELKAATGLAAAASFKHVSPAGAAVAVPLSDDEIAAYEVGTVEMTPAAIAYIRARNADPMSSFGDFAAVSDVVDEATAKVLKREVADGIIAPGFEPAALEILKAKKGGKFIVLEAKPDYEAPAGEFREVYGVGFYQDRNSVAFGKDNLKDVRTKNTLPEEAQRDLVVASICAKYTQSNSVGYAKRGQMVGVGAGQQSRVDCVKLAARKVSVWWLRHHPKVQGLQFKAGTKRQDRVNARVRYIEGDITASELPAWEANFEAKPEALTTEEKEAFLTELSGVSLSSDAFFPFRDSIDHASKVGVSYVAQAGGSVADEQEVEVLSKRYEVKSNTRGGVGGTMGGEAEVNYWKLCEQIEKVFTRRGLEKNPTLDVKLALEDRPGSGYGVHRPGLSEEEAGVIAGLLDRVRLFSATEGLIVKTLFETFDKRHSGRVTGPVFLRQLDSMFKGRLSNDEARVSEASADGEGDDYDDGVSINSSVTGFPAHGTVGFAVGNEPGSGSSSKGGSVGGGGRGGGSGGGWRRAKRVDTGGAEAEAAAAAPPPKDSLPIERQMATKVVYHRLIPEDAFMPYDPTRSGTVTEPVFRRGLSDAFRMPFNDAQLDTLSKRYRHGGSKVNFLRLCDHVYAIADNSVVGFGRQQQNGQGEQHEGGRAEESEGQKETINKALEEIRATLRRRRLSIQPGFQEFDRKCEGHVSVGQLERVLCSYGVLPANRRTQELLAKRYAATDDPRHPTGVFIAYRHLLEDLGEGARGSPGGCLPVGHREGGGGDPLFKGGGGGGWDGEDGYGGGSSSVGGDSCCSTSVAASRVFGKPTGLSRPAHSVVSEVNMTSSVVLGRGRDRGLEELLAQLKALTLRSRLRTLEFFRCDDPMRTGTMSRERFGRSLLSTGFKFSPVELDTLCDAYVDSNLTDNGGAPFVRYGRLVEELEGVFGVRELETKPECDVNASIKAAKDFFASNAGSGSPPEVCPPLSPEEDQVVMETLREIGAEVYRRRLSLTPSLRDFDRFNRGVVPGTMFERALSSVGLLPVRRKTRLLRRKFAERFTSPDARSDVNYVAFLTAVDMAAAGHDKIPDELLIRANANNEHHRAPAAAAGSGAGAGASSVADAVAGDVQAADGVNSKIGGGAVMSDTSLEGVVREVARQLAVGWADITDFLNDADRLKQGEISFPKLKVALALAGVLLTSDELQVLQDGFRSDRSKDMVDWRRLAVEVNKAAGGAPATTSWNGEVFNPSLQVVPNGRRTRNHHHPPQPRRHDQGNSALFPPPTDTPSQAPLSAALSSSMPPRSASLPAPQPHEQQHGRETDAVVGAAESNCRGKGSSGSVNTVNRAAARHQGAVIYQSGAGGGDNPDGGGFGRSPLVTASARIGGGSGGVRPGKEAGDAVDEELLNKTLDAVRHRVKHYRMYLKPSFQDFDPNRKKKITRQQFLSVLGNMNLNLTEREQEAVCRSYTVLERSPGARVRYVDFCEDVDPEHARPVAAKGAAY
eukprot:g13743.t1